MQYTLFVWIHLEAEVRDLCSIPGWERCPGVGNGNLFNILTWKISWTEEPGGLQSTGWLRVGHDWTHLEAIKYGEGNGTPLQYSCLENPMDGGAWKAAVHGVTRSQTRLSDFTLLFHFHALEKEMATHSSVLAWRIPGTGKPCGLPSMGSHRVGYDWSDLAAAAAASVGKLILKDVDGRKLYFSVGKQLDFCGVFIFELLLLKCGLPLTGDTVKHGKWCFVLIKVLAIAEPLWV